MSRFISDYEAELYDNRRTIESLEDDIEDLCTQVNNLTADLNERDGVVELLDLEKQTIIAQCEAWESCYKKVAVDVIALRAANQRLEQQIAADSPWTAEEVVNWNSKNQQQPRSELQLPWLSIQDQPQPPTPTDDQPQAAEHSPSAPKRPPETPLPQYSLRPWGWESPKPESEDPSPQQ